MISNNLKFYLLSFLQSLLYLIASVIVFLMISFIFDDISSNIFSNSQIIKIIVYMVVGIVFFIFSINTLKGIYKVYKVDKEERITDVKKNVDKKQ